MTDAGHDVVYGVRDPGAPGTAVVVDAFAGADVVGLAVPGAAAKNVIAALGGELVGKVVVDATNNVHGSGKLHALDELDDGAHPCARSTRSASRTSPIPSWAAPAPISSTPPRTALPGRRRSG